MKSGQPWVRRSQRVIRMVSELHRMGFQRLRIFPYEYPLAWRLCVAPRCACSRCNGAYVPQLDDALYEHQPTYSSASENEYFNWKDARTDDARHLAMKFVQRFPVSAERGQGRDWEYAGWLAELLGVLERGDLLPIVMAEYFEPGPLELPALPIRDYGVVSDHATRLDFPLPPPGEV
jgi:hypothetical protein